MSAPDTNTQKQADQHRGPLTGMLVAVAFAAVLLVALIVFVVSRGGTPEGADAQVDGRTGAASETAGEPDGTGAIAADSASPEGTATAADPAAPTVAAETVTAPDSGAGAPADTDPAESEAAQPLDAAPAGE